MDREILCVIPARSGSQRIRDKNIQFWRGRPLLSYPIETAKRSKYVTRVIVSTDSPEYARIAEIWGAEVPFLRPAELAEDVPSEWVLKHAVEWLEEHEGYRADPIVLMQCTTPMTSVKDLDGCIELFFKSGADTVVTVREVKDNPRWMFWMAEENRLHSYIGLSGEHLRGRWADSKLHSKLYVPTGGVYVVKRSVLLEKGRIYGDDVRGYVVPIERGWDIDTLDDLFIANSLAEYGLYRHSPFFSHPWFSSYPKDRPTTLDELLKSLKSNSFYGSLGIDKAYEIEEDIYGKFAIVKFKTGLWEVFPLESQKLWIASQGKLFGRWLKWWFYQVGGEDAVFIAKDDEDRFYVKPVDNWDIIQEGVQKRIKDLEEWEVKLE